MKSGRKFFACILASVQLIVFSTSTISVNAENISTEIMKSPSKITSTVLMEKISNDLLDMYDIDNISRTTETSISETLPVMVWFKDISPSLVHEETLKILSMESDSEFSSFTLQDTASQTSAREYISTKRDIYSECYSEYNAQNAFDYFNSDSIMYICSYAPAIVANLSYTEVTTLLDNDNVLCVGYYENSVTEELDLATNITRTSDVIDSNYYGYTGDGVTIGIFDGGIPNQTIPGMNIIDTYGTSTHSHTTKVASILYDIAPDADYYIAGMWDDTLWIDSIEWLLDNDVDVINASLAIGVSSDTSADTNSYTICTLWLEHIVSHHYVSFVKSAGNEGDHGISSGGMAYNVITVGSIDDNGTLRYSDDELASNSSFYDGSDNEGTVNPGDLLAFKPDICAPGVNISTSTVSSDSSGTSLAAAQVTGAIALILEQAPNLSLYPEVIKAILTAGVSIDSPLVYVPADWNEDPSEDSYQLYGAGILDTWNACEIVDAGNYEDGTLTPSRTSKEYTIDVSSSDDRIRISLAFLKSIVASSTHEDEDDVDDVELPDLDLYLIDPDGQIVAHSTTSNNSIEIIDYEFEDYGEYTIEVDQYNTTDESVYYGLAWSIYN